MNAAFFDMDGTIIDSRADLVATVNHTRKDLGLAPASFEEVLKHVGRGAKRLLNDSIPEKSGSLDELWTIFRSHYADHMLENVALYAGVEETLRELKNRGWLLGVNTAKPRFAVDAILDRFGIADLFGGAIIAGGDCDEMKPSAKPLFMCAELMDGHTVTSNDWMVGDNWTDVGCGLNAGVKSAYCAFGFGSIGDSKPTVIIERFSDLLDILK